jgi:hypothetical protein
MTGNRRCPMCAGEPEVDNATCPCEYGYMNEEGSFIAGSMVTSGQALSKEAYEQHNPCEICDQDPSRCERRTKLLFPSRPRRLEKDEQEGYVEFWISEEGISHSMLKRYLEVNSGKHAFCKTGKRFKVWRCQDLRTTNHANKYGRKSMDTRLGHEFASIPVFCESFASSLDSNGVKARFQERTWFGERH